jgi:hypothetical protein
MAQKHRRQHTYQQCPNCGNSVAAADSFCAQCGQSTHDLHVPLKHLLADALDDFLQFDGKSLHTLKALLFKPGQLTLDFMHGRRIRYVTPLRFYLFISVVFFFVLAIPKREQEKEPGTQTQGMDISFWGIQSSELKGVPPSRIDSVLQAHSIELTLLNRYIGRQMIRMQTSGSREFSQALMKGVSYMMFVLMPVFGWFVFLLHRKEAKRYIGSLIFSVHYHSFVFLVLAVFMVFRRIESMSWAPALILFMSPIYLVQALRRVYNGSLFRTVLKTMLLGILQFIFLMILFLLTMVLSLLLF